MNNRTIEKLPPAGHIGFVVPDIIKATEQAKKVFGIKDIDVIFDFVPTRCWAWGKEINDCHLKIAMADWTDNLKIEFIQPCGGDIHYSRFLKETGGGIQHTAHYVKGYDGFRGFLLNQ